jgi:23S rRNA pseudouridine1911/1915/1917 synthase
VEKSYLALVHGRPPDDAVIEAPLARLGEHGPSPVYLKQGVVPGGTPARTRIQRLATQIHPRAGGISQVACFPETGRLHQIRVHLAHLGHPVVGDKLYGPDPCAYLEFIETGWTDALATRLFHPRQALHATRMGFDHDGIRVRLDDPWPQDLMDFWNECR